MKVELPGPKMLYAAMLWTIQFIQVNFVERLESIIVPQGLHGRPASHYDVANY
jgi:hypothetical protein